MRSWVRALILTGWFAPAPAAADQEAALWRALAGEHEVAAREAASEKLGRLPRLASQMLDGDHELTR
jgi:hypothetical protein